MKRNTIRILREIKTLDGGIRTNTYPTLTLLFEKKISNLQYHFGQSLKLQSNLNKTRINFSTFQLNFPKKAEVKTGSNSLPSGC